MNIFTRITPAFIKPVFVILLLTAFARQSIASHMAGGDIEYTCIGPRKWAIKLTLYRFCEGISICPSFACTRQITVTPSPGVSFGGMNPDNCAANPNQLNVTMQLQSVVDLQLENNERCGVVAKNGCDNLGQVTPGSYRPSAEKLIFTGTLDMSHPSLGTASTCPYWDVAFTESARNDGTVNIQNPGGTNFCITATINIQEGQANLKNNSVVFKREGLFAFCGGQEYVYNMAAVDPDGDSLTYLICKSLAAPNVPVNYNLPFNEKYPFPLLANQPPHNNYTGTPFVVLDSLNGNLSMNANNPGPNPIGGDLSVRVYQWRYREQSAGSGKMVPFIVGMSMRNLQIYSIPCLGNNPPKLATNPPMPGGEAKMNWEVCAGQQLCFTITAKDTDYKPNNTPPRIDSTFLSWDQSIVRPGKISFVPDYDISNASMRPREDRWKFCWQTELSDTSTLPYYFTVRGMDNMCPNPGKVTRAFSIKVGRNVNADLVKESQPCGKWRLSVRKTNVTQSFNWAMLQIANQPDDYNFTGGAKTILSANPNPAGTGTAPRVVIKDSVQFTKPGKYYIRYTITSVSTGCPSVFNDSIVIDANTWLSVMLNDSVKCKTGSINFSANTNGGTSPYSYKWYRNNTSSQPLNAQPGATVFVASDTITAKYFIQVKDSNNCTAWDTAELVVKRIGQNPILINDSSQCIGLNNFSFSHMPLAGFSNYSIKWLSDQSVSTDSVWNKKYTTSGARLVKLVVNEAAGCTDTVSRAINVWPVPSVANVIKVNDSIQCIKGNEFKFSYARLPELNYKWLYNDTVSTDTILTRSYGETGTKTVRLIIGDSGCVDTATRTVQITPIPQAGKPIIVDDSLQCLTGNAFKFSYAKVPVLTYTWLHDFNMTPDSVLKKTYTTAGTKTVKLIVSREGCSDTASQDVKVTARPVVANIITVNKNTQCVGNNNFVFTRSNTNDSNVFKHAWFNGDSLVYAPSLAVKYTSTGLKRMKLVITQPGACTDTASLQVSVTSVPVAAGTIKINDSIQCISNNQFRLSYSKTAGPLYKWIYNNTTSTDSVIMLNYTSTGSRSVRLMVGEPGCSDTATQVLIVTAAPIANNDIIVNNAGQCLTGNRFRFSYSKKPLTDYKWIYNNTTSKDSVIQLTYSDTGLKTIKLMLGEPGCSDTAVQQINVWPLPVTKNVLSVNDTVQCLTGNSFILTYNAANNPYHFTNTWLYETQVSGNHQVNPIYQDAGIKQVKLVLATVNGCKDTLLKNLLVKPSPVQPSIQGQKTSVLVNTEYDYSVTAQAGNGYKWSAVNGSFISSDTIPAVRIKWTAEGQASLSVQQDLDGCTAKDSVALTILSTGLNETKNIEKLSISPNPNNGSFVINLDAKSKSHAQIKVYDALGAVVFKADKDLVAGSNEIKIESHVSPGVYLLVIQEAGGMMAQKVLIKQ